MRGRNRYQETVVKFNKLFKKNLILQGHAVLSEEPLYFYNSVVIWPRDMCPALQMCDRTNRDNRGVLP